MSSHRCVRCKAEKTPELWGWYDWLPQHGEPEGSRYWVLCGPCESNLAKKAFYDELSGVGCNVREHVGLEKIIHKIGMDQPLLPDPKLGQDIALVAHMLTTAREHMNKHDQAMIEILKIAKEALGLDQPGVGQGIPS